MGSSEGEGASLKRTDLLEGRGFVWAAEKSGARVGLLGRVIVVVVEEGVAVEEEVENWEDRSACWDFRRGSWDVIDLVGWISGVLS